MTQATAQAAAPGSARRAAVIDPKVQLALDALLEDDVRRGARGTTVPPELRALLVDAELPDIPAVRFTRLNPRRRALISQTAQRQYQRDLRNPDILSRAQLLALVKERGDWDEAKDARIKALQASVKKVLGDLYYDGLTEQDWEQQVLTELAALRAAAAVEGAFADVEARGAFEDRLERWVMFAPDRQALYDTRHAPSQGRDRYSPDADYSWLLSQAPTADAADRLNLLDELRDKLLRYLAMAEEQRELEQLREQYARIFAESLEDRRDNTEELARLYYTTERLATDDPESAVAGPLVAEFDQMWDLPEPLVRWLIVEAYYVAHGVTAEARALLASSMGFPQAGRQETAPTPETTPETAPETAEPVAHRERPEPIPAPTTPSAPTAASSGSRARRSTASPAAPSTTAAGASAPSAASPAAPSSSSASPRSAGTRAASSGSRARTTSTTPS